MDNASIHRSQPMIRKIEKRGYKIMYPPPYSSELNPIEQFWYLVKSKLKRQKLLDNKTLSTRIADACNEAHLSDLAGLFNHSKRQIIKVPF